MWVEMWVEMKHGPLRPVFAEILAEWTGLEPATPGVTGRYSNQLNYHSNGAGSVLAIATGAA